MSDLENRINEYLETIPDDLIGGDNNLVVMLRDANRKIEQLQKDKAELIETIKLVRDDLRMRGDEEGVVNISGFIWIRINEALNSIGEDDD